MTLYSIILLAIRMLQQKTQTQTKTKPTEKPYVIVDFLDLDPAMITFLPPKANNHGGHFVPIRYNGKSLYVTYESRTCPFGISTSTDNKPEYKGKYADSKKINGYTTSISCYKDYDKDPYYLKAVEMDQFFIGACHENALYWHLGGTTARPLSLEAVEGLDHAGVSGLWKRFLKYSYKKNDQGERVYLEYAPRLEFGVPTSSMTEHMGPDNLMVQEAVLKPVFFDVNAQKLEPVTSMEADQVLPKWSKISVLAHWSTVTQGTYGASLKPKVQQFRVFPSEQLAVDECLLGDDGEEEYDLGDHFGGNPGESVDVPVTKLSNTAPPMDMGDEEDQYEEEVIEIAEEVVPAAPAAPPPKRVTRPTRRVVTPKSKP